MKALLLIFCGLVVGGLVGMWMGSSMHKPASLAKVTKPGITYVLTDYQMANAIINPGDTITLEDTTGNTKGLWMNFQGNSPCDVASKHLNPCTIKGTLGTGYYFFTCDNGSGNGDVCPDPGIQPAPGTLVVEGGSPKKPLLTTSSLDRLIVSCDTTTNPSAPATVLQYQQNGKTAANDTEPKGTTVFWLSSDNFTLTTSNYPTGFCTGTSTAADGNPGVTNEPEASCAISQTASSSISYTVLATVPGTSNTACGKAIPATLKLQ